MKLFISVLLLLVFISTPVIAKNIEQELLNCSSFSPSPKRLACYDNLAKHLSAHPPTAKNMAIPNTAIKVDVDSKPDQDIVLAKFGLPDKSPVKKVDMLSAIVVSLKRNAYKKIQLSLDNGQVWMQKDSTQIHFKIGDTVIIKRGALGSFFIAIKGRTKRMRAKRKS